MLEKLGRWFHAIRQYECEGCGAAVQMGYSEKVDLFEAYGGMTRNRSNSDRGPRNERQLGRHRGPDFA
jgi:hypothetical protein